MPSNGFCCSSGPQSENQRKQKEIQVFRPCLRTEKAMKHEGDGDTDCNWQVWKEDWKREKSEDKLKPFRQQHC